jgi:hypothetical protein
MRKRNSMSEMTTTPGTPTDPQALADAVTQAMWSRDRATQGLGMQIQSVKPGYATDPMPCAATWSTATTSATAV